MSADRPTKAEAFDAAGQAFARSLESVYGLDGTSVEQAADAAFTPGGPTRDDLVERITRRRVAAGLMADPAAEHKAAS